MSPLDISSSRSDQPTLDRVCKHALANLPGVTTSGRQARSEFLVLMIVLLVAGVDFMPAAMVTMVLVDHRVPAAPGYEVAVHWKGRYESDGQGEGETSPEE